MNLFNDKLVEKFKNDPQSFINKNGVCNIPYGVTNIPNNAFYNCPYITSVVIPDSVSTIEQRAFHLCKNLKTVSIPKGVTSIAKKVFDGCVNLQTVTIPNSVTTIGDNAFNDCVKLKNVHIPDSVTTIGENAFYKCKTLKTVSIPDSVKSIGNSAFGLCFNLKQISIPDGITSLGKYVFYQCENLKNVTIPDSVQSIGYNAFGWCFKLKQINLPRSLTSIGINAFNLCSNLKNITIPDGVTSIQAAAFTGCDNITKIVIPDSVQNIGNQAFSGCRQLASIKIPDRVTKIGQWTFLDCRSLKNIDIPDSVTNIEEGAFHRCYNLTNLTIPNSVTKMGEGVFYQCKSIQQVTISNRLTLIPKNTFSDCDKLNNVIIGSGVEKIGAYAFQNCKSLKNITIPNNVTIIDKRAFTYCTNLATIDIPNSVTNIENYAFSGCEKLTSVTIGQGVKIFGHDVFENCKKLNQLNICGKQIMVEHIKPMRLFGDDPIREYFYANKYNKQLKLFVDKKINMPVEIIENLINQNILDCNKPFNCKHLINELDCVFKNDKKLLKEFQNARIEQKIDFYKLANNIGAFSSDNEISQKASSTMASLLKDKTFSMYDFFNYFDKIDFSNTNKNVFEFLSAKNKNLNEIIELERMYPKMLSKIINNYDAFLDCKTTIDHNGKPKKISLKDAAIKLYTQTVYNNVESDNEHIANEFAKFALPQECFDQALKFQKMSAEKTNILNEKFIETSLFEQIEDIQNDTENKIVSAQKLAKEFLEKKFTYEILNKQDPKNLTLGAYCSCCANINSNYYGKNIAISSFTSSNIDNIVVKDTQGLIIAKGTIYVNRENGYAVINNFELNYKYKRDGEKTQDKQLIFNTFKRAVGSFVDRYNVKNDTPITKVNVGLGFNRLAEYTKELEKESKLLKVPDRYTFNDASKEQYTLYKNDEKTQ